MSGEVQGGSEKDQVEWPGRPHVHGNARLHVFDPHNPPSQSALSMHQQVYSDTSNRFERFWLSSL
eukprot:7657740-Alexandrium_andersonii.AAC.1